MNQSQIRKTSIAGLVIAVIGCAVAGLLVCKHVFPDFCKGAYGCTISGVDGCAELGSSKYSKLFGLIPIAIPGFFYYSFCAALLYMIYRTAGMPGKDSRQQSARIYLLLVVAIFGAVFDAVLGYVNFFVLLVPCKLCIYTYVCTAGLLGCAIWLNSMNKKNESTFAESVKSSVPFAITGIAATGLLFLGLFCASKIAAGPSSELLPPDQVQGFLTEFRALNKVDLRTDGLTNVEGDGQIVIHKFADFLCPHCFHASLQLQALMARWPGRLKIYYRHFPLDGLCNPLVQRRDPAQGEMRCNGAQSALCAPQQNIFVPVYHGIFNLQRNPDGITLSALQNLTEKSGGNWQKMISCMGSAGTNAALQRDIKDAQTINLNSTPTIVVADRLLPPGTPDELYFKHLIDALVYEKEGDKGYQEFGGRAR